MINPTLSPVIHTMTVSHELPNEYKWINNIGQLPKTMAIILPFCGLLEKRGADNNPTIISWADELKVKSIYSADSIPWCGLGQGIGVKRAGYELPKGFLGAKNWSTYGVHVPIHQVKFGHIVVLNRGNNPELGHVCRWICGNDEYFVGYGANQADSWSFAIFPNIRIFAVREDPFKIGPPASVKKYPLVLKGGKVSVSVNEA